MKLSVVLAAVLAAFPSCSAQPALRGQEPDRQDQAAPLARGGGAPDAVVRGSRRDLGHGEEATAPQGGGRRLDGYHELNNANLGSNFPDYHQGLQGYCQDSYGRIFGAVYDKLADIDITTPRPDNRISWARHCGDWCNGFKSAGFVGFMIGGTTGIDYCACRYDSDAHVDQAYDKHWEVNHRNANYLYDSGRGAINRTGPRSANWANVACFPVRESGGEGSNASQQNAQSSSTSDPHEISYYENCDSLWAECGHDGCGSCCQEAVDNKCPLWT